MTETKQSGEASAIAERVLGKRKVVQRVGAALSLIGVLLAALIWFDRSSQSDLTTSEFSSYRRFNAPVPVSSVATTSSSADADKRGSSIEEVVPSVDVHSETEEVSVAVAEEETSLPNNVEPVLHPSDEPESLSVNGEQNGHLYPQEAHVDKIGNQQPLQRPEAKSHAASKVAPPPQREASQAKKRQQLAHEVELQAGIFADPEGAHRLHDALIKERIPVRLETRVIVGPFTTTQEAKKVQNKLKRLGYETIAVKP